MKQHDDSRPGSFKSGGQRIDDHSFWAGKAEKGGVFPKEAKMKEYSSAEGAGSVPKYEDTDEAIKATQVAGIGKAKRYASNPMYRN
jgi:hypothetical protein